MVAFSLLHLGFLLSCLLKDEQEMWFRAGKARKARKWPCVAFVFGGRY